MAVNTRGWRQSEERGEKERTLLPFLSLSLPLVVVVSQVSISVLPLFPPSVHALLRLFLIPKSSPLISSSFLFSQEIPSKFFFVPSVLSAMLLFSQIYAPILRLSQGGGFFAPIFRLSFGWERKG